MNQLRRIILAPALIALAFTLAMGCAGKTAYRATATTTLTVSAAIHAWSDYVDTGAASVSDRQKVLAAIEKYNAALHVAQTAVDQWFISQAAGATFPQAATAALSASSVDLVKLINQLITKKGS